MFRIKNNEIKQLRKIYRELVKKLHPDLNPDLSEKKKNLFQHTLSAYENGNLKTLREISILLEDDKKDFEENDSMTNLYKDKERLEEILKNLIDYIAKVKISYPFTLKEILDDEKKIEARRMYFSDSIEDSKASIQVYESRIKELMKL